MSGLNLNLLKPIIGGLKLGKLVRQADHNLHAFFNRFRKKRRVLFCGYSMMNFNMIKPLYELMRKSVHADIFFCFCCETQNEKGETFTYSLNLGEMGIPADRMLTKEQVVFKKWDLVIDSDYCTPLFQRYTTLIQVFHGIAAKKVSWMGKEVNFNYHPSLKNYDICFFINRVFCEKSRELGLWKNADSGEVTGMMCHDDFLSRNNSRDLPLLKARLVPESFRERKVVLYAPSWGEDKSFYTKGKEILTALSMMDVFVILKPHPRSIVHGMKNVPVSVREFLAEKFPEGNYAFLEDSPYEALLAADLVVTDFGSLAMETTLLNKPIGLFVCPGTEEGAADETQYRMLKECCFLLDSESKITQETFEIKEPAPAQLEAMKEFRETYFANRGYAAKTALRILVKRGLLVPRNCAESQIKVCDDACENSRFIAEPK